MMDGYVFGQTVTQTKEVLERLQKAKELMEFLGIPVNPYGGAIQPIDLYDMLMDDKKCQELIAKLKNKAFW